MDSIDFGVLSKILLLSNTQTKSNYLADIIGDENDKEVDKKR